MRRFFKSTWNTLSLRLSLLLPVVLLFSAMVSATAFAEVQEVSLDPSSVMVAAGAPVSLALIYDVDINDNTLGGVGIWIHYNSAILTYTGPSNVFNSGLSTNPAVPQTDEGDADGDPDTDMIILFGYSDPFGGNWPNQPLPLTLADLGFTADAAASPGAVTNVNVTFVSNPVGYTGAGNNAIITIICENGTTRSCGSDTGECVAGLETCVGGAWSGVCEGEVGPTDETCDNLDNDCDGATDENLTQATSCGVGECGATGIETCTGGAWGGDTCTPGTPSAETCDNLDNDCDGATDEDLTQATSCGVGVCSNNTGIETCAAGTWQGDTCDPFDGATADTNCNGLDEDCDGSADNGYIATTTSCGVGECDGNAGLLECVDGTPTDTCNPFAGSAAETCDNLDNDCDGTADEDLTQATTCGVGGCAAAGIETCTGGVFSGDTCTPGEPALDDATCDGIDNDCDGTTDEDYVPDSSCFLPGVCSAGDTTSSCFAGVETTCSTGTPAIETCDNLDNDCDGSTDEDLTQATTCGVGGCAAAGIETCTDGVFSGDTCTPGEPSDEICDNIDNNCDGVTDEDLADSDGDGICDDIDNCFGDGNDTDEDGVCDNLDACPGFNDAADKDGDGSPDACEMGPDHDDDQYDGNGDTFPDWDQANVASLFANAGQSYVTLSTNEDCSLQEVFNYAPDGSEPEDATFPFGLFRFTVDCTAAVLDPVGQVMVTFRMPDGTNKRNAITVNTYEKADDQGAWYDFRRVDGTGPGVDFLDDEIFMYFEDNEIGDNDLTDNVFKDPGGPAFVDGLPDPPTSGATGKSGSSCFIETLFSSFGKNK